MECNRCIDTPVSVSHDEANSRIPFATHSCNTTNQPSLFTSGWPTDRLLCRIDRQHDELSSYETEAAYNPSRFVRNYDVAMMIQPEYDAFNVAPDNVSNRRNEDRTWYTDAEQGCASQQRCPSSLQAAQHEQLYQKEEYKPIEHDDSCDIHNNSEYIRINDLYQSRKAPPFLTSRARAKSDVWNDEDSQFAVEIQGNDILRLLLPEDGVAFARGRLAGDIYDDDALLAAKLQAEWEAHDKVQAILQCEAGQFLAMELQRKFEEEEAASKEARRLQREEELKASLSKSKAVSLVHQILEVIQSCLEASYDSSETVKGKVTPFTSSYLKSINSDIFLDDSEEMILSAQRFIETQETFKTLGYSPSELHVDIGYHYTNEESIEVIQSIGLLTGTERETFDIDAFSSNGDYFGDGVYTGNNPFAFKRYGTIGLLVARIKGRVYECFSRFDPILDNDKNSTIRPELHYDTVSGNKWTITRAEFCDWNDPSLKKYWPGNNSSKCSFSSNAMLLSPSITLERFWDEDVLQSSAQCFPLVKYDAPIIHNKLFILENQGNCCIIELQERIQAVLDHFLNNGNETTVPLPLTVVSAIPTFVSYNSKVHTALEAANIILNEQEDILQQQHRDD